MEEQFEIVNDTVQDLFSYDARWTPPWLLPRGTRRLPPDAKQQHTARYLFGRMCAAGLDAVHARPDAWVNLKTRALVYADPQGVPADGKDSPSRHEHTTDAFTPLRIGDCVYYTQVLRMSFVTHDMIYVGMGCVVGFARRQNDDGEFPWPWRPLDEHASAIRLERIDRLTIRGKTLHCAPFETLGSPLTRTQAATRALASLGTYTYQSRTFNCQHVNRRFLALSWRSIGVERIVGLGIVCTVAACVVLVVIVCAARVMHMKKLRR